MRILFWQRPAIRSSCPAWILTVSYLASLTRAFTANKIDDPTIDLSQLGEVLVAGDFVGISTWQYKGQNERPFSTNGSEQLMAQLPNGLFSDLLDADASILAMCQFRNAIYLGGNFTSLGNRQSTGFASYNLDTGALTPLGGLTGQVTSLLCDESAGKIYIGGSFSANGSMNAITFTSKGKWENLSFEGFNGAVSAITRNPNGHIIFGGSFTGLGNASTTNDTNDQAINLSSANLQGDGSSTQSGFSDPANIVCKNSKSDGAGNTWLLQDGTAGSWTAKFGFGFEPSKLRLWNTNQDGRGTKTFRFTALPINGIMNLTYIDPASGNNVSCTSECPLAHNTSIQFQDFHFVNTVGMDEFRLDISAWYGAGGGLDGIEIFEQTIFTYAINDFNEPSCSGGQLRSTTSSSGGWVTTSSQTGNSAFLSVNLTTPISSDAPNVTFQPDIKESGEYIVRLYTPGCLDDNSCSRRGQVNVTWTLTEDAEPNSTVLFQTNNYDKYDTLTIGAVDVSSDSFRPTVTLAPSTLQQISDLTIVAQRVGFELINSTGGLNGLFEYDPSVVKVSTSDFAKSTFDRLGSSFSKGSAVMNLLNVGDKTYIAGNFTSEKANNIIAVNHKDNTTTALDGGLNGAVSSLYASGGRLYAGGNFNNTEKGSDSSLNNAAYYDIAGNAWKPLGAGVDDYVENVVPMSLNISSTTPEEVITFTGHFRKILAFDGHADISVPGFAVWVKSQNNWLQNIKDPKPFVTGRLSTALLDLPSNVSVYGGSLYAEVLAANGIASLTGSNSLGSVPVQLQPRSPSTASTGSSNLSKRSSLTNQTDNTYGVVTGAFYNGDDKNITVLAGHFDATTSSGSTVSNLVILDGSENSVSGLPAGVSSSSVFLTSIVQGDSLFAGGQVNGTINNSPVTGLIRYDLAGGKFGTQPPSLSGNDQIVNTIQARPNSEDVYVGGSFTLAGSLGCPAICKFSTATSQWSRPGAGLLGTVNTMLWTNDTRLVVGGNLTVNGRTTYVASFDTSSSTWTSFSGATSLPGPMTVLTAANSDSSQLWAAGASNSTGKPYVVKYDGSSWRSADLPLGQDSVIRSLQVFTVTADHDSTDLVESNRILMLTGPIHLPIIGTVSSAIWDGSNLQPFALTGSSANTAGSISRIFTSQQNFFTSSGGGMPVGFVVLIGLAISLGLMLMIVVGGLALDRYRKKREGYVPAPAMYDQAGGMQRVPPHQLLQSLQTGSRAPHV